MRRMFSEKQIKEMIAEEASAEQIVAKLVGENINVNTITSNGIVNTGYLENNGDLIISGNLDLQGEGKGELIANTLRQRNPNWETPITLIGHNGGANYKAELTYGKCVLIGCTLYIVAIVKCENIGDSSISHPTPSFSNILFPENIAAKIYDLDGKNLTENPITANCPITSSVRGGTGNISQWTEQFTALPSHNAKLDRASLLNTAVIKSREGLPTLDAGETGYLLIGFELVII